MIGFESYLPSAWEHDGLLMQTAARSDSEKKSRRAGRSFHVSLAASLVGVGLAMSQLFVPTPAAAGNIHNVVVTSKPSNAPRKLDGLDVPPGYWSGLVTALGKLPQLVERNDVPDPEPLI